MFQSASAPARGSRSKRLGRPSNRSGIQKRNGGPIRVDKDGDLDMDATGVISKGRNGENNGNRDALRIRGTSGPGSSRDPKAPRSTRTGLNATAVQKAILRGMGSAQDLPRGRASTRLMRPMGREGLSQIIVRGFKNSKAASNPDGGIKDLLGFLERKASAPDASAREMVRITKSRLDGDALIISLRTEDLPKITRLDKYTFAGVPLDIELYKEDRTQTLNSTDSTNDVSAMLKAMLSRRYNPELKLLDLSHLGNESELINIGMFSTSSRESKFFPALMKICDSIFTTAEQKSEAVVSVSLASNSLMNITSVTALAQTFPDVKNLDLSNNLLRNLSALEGWRWKFRHLDHLILSGNPLEAEEQSFKEDILKWYPTLRTLNTVQVRSSDEVKATAEKVTLPIPVLGPSFRDEASIGETFVKQFFTLYDSDRAALVKGYYDAQSTFSLSINVSAPRASALADQKVPNWDSYIKRSRNLTKVTHLPARVSRMRTGTDSIQQCWLTLPSTLHPNMLAEPEKWCIECNSLPGLPDLSGQVTGGVGGLIITIHGQFSEVDVSTRQNTNNRSFDRTFVLGPGNGAGGVRVVCDTLVLRAWGGSDAWKPQGIAPLNVISLSQPTTYSVSLPEGFGVPGLGKTEEQVQKEIVAVELSKRTGMTLEYSGMCLEQSGWEIDGAVAAFEQAKANLPVEAFIPL